MSGRTDMNLLHVKDSKLIRIAVTLALCMCILVLFVIPSGMALAQATAPVPTQGPSAEAANGVTCTFYNWPLNLRVCVFGAMFAYGSEVIIWVAGSVLEIGATLLNYSLELTIGSGQANTGFESQIYSRIKPGVEAVWTAFRDISNIVIIGMFTFIALSMILGIEKFGAKKMVANVLIIAVLINFSLLFTRLIIGSSNFVATQFYKAAQLDAGSPAAAGASASTAYSTGISGRFARMMGVAGFGETGNALFKLGQKADSALLPLMQGILTAIVFLGAALMFFYAAFLLIARAILFILLLITSSLAFASYLIPGGGFGGYGWSQWWSSLLKNAAFGPLLLIFMWATLKLGEGLQAKNSSIGGLLDETGSGMSALFSYLMVLGMLYASIKIASSFSQQIGGFGATIRGMSAPFAMGLGYGYAPIARRFFGGGAYKEKVRLESELEDAKTGKGKYGKLKGSERIATLASLGKQLDRASARAKSDYNPMNSWAGRKVADKAGLNGILSGQTKTQGYAQQVDKSAKQLADTYGAAVLSSDDKKKMLDTAIKSVDDHADVKRLKSDRDAARAAADAAKTIHGPAKTAADAELERARKTNEAELAAIRATIKAAADDLGKNPASALHRGTLSAAEAKERILLQERDVQISGAQEKVNKALKTIEGIDEPVRTAENKLNERRTELEKDVAARIEGEVNDYSNDLKKALGKSTLNADVARAALKKLESSKDDKQLRKLFEKYAEDTRSSDDTAKPPKS